MPRLTFFFRSFFSVAVALIWCCFGGSYDLRAQETLPQRPGRLTPAYVQLDGQERGAEGALAYLRRSYKLDNRVQFAALHADRDALGQTHLRFAQTYEGHPVSGGMVLVHLDRSGAVQSINGDLFAVPDAKPSAPAVAESAALAAALKQVGAAEYLWEGDTARLPAAYAAFKRLPQGTLVWAPKNGNHGVEPMRLAWKFDVYARKPLKREFVYVDAATGTVLWEENRIHEGSANGSANTLFSGVRPLVTDSVSTTLFRLWDTTRGGGIRTWDMNTGTYVSSAVDFTDADNYWNNTANMDRAAGDVHWGHEKVYDYFDTAHGRQSYDDADAALNGYVHYDVNMVNAFWDGTALYYGDGDASQGFSPLTCLDIVGHEFTHGVTEHTAGLIYSYESGALNESFSDIFGNTIERVVKPTTANWKVGEEMSSTGAGLRNMANPNQYNQPDTYLGTYWYTGSLDNGGVHYNSGVQNFWYHILAAGDTGVNDNGNAYSVAGIGMYKASKIAYRCLTTYLTPSSQYADARFYAIQAAKDLYGSCSQEVIQTTNAWYAVGVGAAYTVGTGVSFTATPTASCHLPVTVQFTNTSASALSSVWSFGNGATSTAQNPSYTYTAQGQYTVKLKVTRCNSTVDSVTYTNFITVDTTATMCDTVVLTSSTQQTISACSGIIVDNGGINGSYTNNVNSGVLVTATPGSYVRFKFNQLALESCCDFVSVYNGSTTAAPLIGTYTTGTTMPGNGGWIYTTSNQFLVRFSTDMSVTDQGFVLQFECITAPPDVSFYSPDSLSCDPSVDFVNTSTPTSGVTWAWTFGDGTTSTAANPTKTYAAQGNYTVRLIGCNNFGCDTQLRTAYIRYDTTQLFCQTTLIPSYSTSSLVRCSGQLTDNGGLNGNYTNYNYGGTAVSTTGGNVYRLKFTQMKIQSGDVLTIYNGSNASAPVLGTYTGSTLPNNGNWFYTSGPQFYAQFTTDGWGVDSGFRLTYECQNITPIPNFYSADSISCDNSVAFTNTSIGATSYLWSFGDGTTSTLANPTKLYAAQGTYTIKLKACNGTSCDSLTRTAYIKYDTTQMLCQTAVVPISGTGYVTRCSGYVTDPGGLTGNYPASYSYGATAVSSSAGTYYRFRFLQLRTDSLNSFVSVYNGTTTYGTPIGQYSGKTLPNNGNWMYTSGPQFTVVFYNGSYLSDSGFVLQYECQSGAPLPNFYSVDSVSCDNSVVFTNTSSGATSYLWSFGDGTTSTLANPTKYYAAQGNYTIKLKACNGSLCDSLTRTAYIKYDTTLGPCMTSTTPVYGTTYVTRCTGLITDDGGNGLYGNWMSGGVAVSTTGGNQYRVRFTQLKTESCCDYVRLYNGSSIYTPLIGQYQGSTLPNNGNWIYTSGPQFYVQFYSNGSVVDSGFKLEYECLNSPPVVSFSSPDTISCDNSVVFTNSTTPVASNYTYLWNFGDGTTSTLANPTKFYAAQGTYTIKLKVCNGGLCDSLTKPAYIKYDTTLGPCVTSMTPSSGTVYVTRCTGVVTDAGGANGPYGYWNYGGVSVSTTGGNQYRLKFTQLKLQTGVQVNIYNGTSTGSPLLGSYTGSTLPNGGNWIYTSGAQFYVQLYNNGYAVDSGFKLEYECLNSPPTVSFYSPDSVSCDNSVVFYNTTTPTGAYTYLWSFGDGTTSTLPNPVKYYSAQGTYTVKLKVCKGTVCDSLTKPAYIKYDTTLGPCITSMTPVYSTTYVTRCTGFVTDDGGANGPYSNWAYGGVSVNTTGGNQYRVRFNQMKVQAGDQVTLYDGATNYSPIIGTYTGSTLPNNGNWIYTSGAQFYVQFESNGSVVDSGFKLEYECLNAPPTASFYSPDSISCDPSVAFVNTTTPVGNYTYLWSFGDGTTSTVANPVKIYAAQGTYTVKLKVCSGTTCDSVTRTGYIKYDTTLGPCQITTMPTSGTTTITKCTGLITDNGGVNGYYTNNVYSGISVNTTAGSAYRVRFTQLRTESCCDFVALYSGANTSAPLVGQYQGWTLPNNGNWIYINSPQFYVQFYSNSWSVDSGFKLEYECLPGMQVIASFQSPDSVSCDNSVVFVNNSTNATTYLWSFGDGTTSTAANPTKFYATPGIYTVSLTACNGSGPCSTLTKPAYINYNPFLPGCNNYVLPSGTTPGTITGICNGALYDNGGLGNYTNNTASSTLITGTTGLQLRLSFSEFDMQQGDVIRLYDGPTTASPLLAELSGNGLPMGTKPIWTRGNQVLVTQNTNSTLNSTGFILNWVCAAKAVDSFSFARFDVDTVDYCAGQFTFEAQQATPLGITGYEIASGDGAVYNSGGPVSHTYTQSGSFTPRLKISTSSSSFFEYASLNITPVIAAGAIPDTVAVQQSFNLFSTSTNAASTAWYVDGVLAGQTPTLMTQFSTAGAHIVRLTVANGGCADTLSKTVWVRDPLGVEATAADAAIQLYPNPASRALTLRMTGVPLGQKTVVYRIRNAAGQLVQTGEAPVANGRVQHTLALPELASGLYSFTLEAGSKPQTTMFRVQQ